MPVRRIRLHGPQTAITADALMPLFADLAEEMEHSVEIDLADVSAIDPVFAGLLSALGERLARHSLPLTLRVTAAQMPLLPSAFLSPLGPRSATLIYAPSGA